MKTISVSDLMLIPELSHWIMPDFINPANDKIVASYLKVLGFDLDYPLVYKASQHRNLQGKVVIGYTIAGEVECNSVFTDSSFCTLEDRTTVAAYSDLGLAQDMELSARKTQIYEVPPEVEQKRRMRKAKASKEYVTSLPEDQCNPNEKEILEQIEILEHMLYQARGNPFKTNGERKTLAEVAQGEPQITRKKRKNKTKENYGFTTGNTK